MAILTKEYLFQYQAHHILKKAYKEYLEYDSPIDFDKWLETKDGKIFIAETFLEEVEQWCGLDEAIEKES